MPFRYQEASICWKDTCFSLEQAGCRLISKEAKELRVELLDHEGKRQLLPLPEYVAKNLLSYLQEGPGGKTGGN